MNILICAGMYYPFRGGYFESIHGLAKELIREGHRISILTCNTHKQPTYETFEGATIVRMDCINPAWLYNTFPIPLPTVKNFRILKKITKENWDIISTQTRFFTTTWIGFFIAKIKKISLIHTERGAT